MNEIQIYDKIDTVNGVAQLGEWFAKSGMFGCTKVEQGNILALQCLAERKTPLDMARTYHIIEGKLSKRSDAILADYRKAGGKVKWIKFDDKEARAIFSFEDNEIEVYYTINDARKAGLIKPRSGWETHPADMLRSRLISKTVRMLAPETIAGQYTPEELQDEPRHQAPNIKTAEKVTGSTESESETVEIIDDESNIDFIKSFFSKSEYTEKFILAKFKDWEKDADLIASKIRADEAKFLEAAENYVKGLE